MHALAEFIVRLANLIEAEGRALKSSAARFVIAVLVWVAAAVLLIAGVLGVAVAFFLALIRIMDPVAVLVLLAVLLLLAGVAGAIVGKLILGSTRRKK